MKLIENISESINDLQSQLDLIYYFIQTLSIVILIVIFFVLINFLRKTFGKDRNTLEIIKIRKTLEKIYESKKKFWMRTLPV